MAAIQAVLAAEQDEAKKAAVAARHGGRPRVRRVVRVRAGDHAGAARGLRARRRRRPVRHALPHRPRPGGARRSAPPRRCRSRSARFFAGLGLRILDVYGMTETTGAATANTPDAFKLGTVGRPMPGIELQVAGDGEILLRGGTCTPGYLNLPEATADLLDDDGWVHTGDIGVIDDDGFLTDHRPQEGDHHHRGRREHRPVDDREPPQGTPLVGQALAYGDRRPYVVAVLTLDAEVATVWAAAHGYRGRRWPRSPPTRWSWRRSRAAVAAANERLARVQQVKHWQLLPVEWTAESEELTPTLKLKRRVVHASTPTSSTRCTRALTANTAPTAVRALRCQSRSCLCRS